MKNSRSINLLLALLRVSLGLFFAYTGIAKIDDLGETATFLLRSRLFLPDWATMPIACTGVAMEILVALCLIFRREYRGATAWGVVMCSVFWLLYVQAWIRGLELSCNCMGSAHEIANYPQDIAVRTLLLGAMLLLLWDARRPDSGLSKTKRLDFSDL